LYNAEISNVIYKRKKNKVKFNFPTALKYFFLTLWAILTIAPLLWVLLNSFKTSQEILTNAISLPTSFSFSNFMVLGTYSQVNIPRAFLNSIIISGSTVVLVLVFGSMAAFVLSRFKFALNGPIKMLLIASMLVPQFAVIVPNIKVLRFFHFNGTYLAVIAPHTAGFLNFAIIMMAGFMVSIPVELEEAAIIDGCSIPKIFFNIIVPLSKPIFATTGIMIFLWSYNDLLLPLVYLTGNMLPVSVLMTQVSSLYNTNYGAMMAAVVITILPVIILYILSQEYVVKGLTAGAVKG
jgi:raffinose/stachyose/melibiose transport system permease protein